MVSTTAPLSITVVEYLRLELFISDPNRQRDGVVKEARVMGSNATVSDGARCVGGSAVQLLSLMY